MDHSNSPLVVGNHSTTHLSVQEEDANQSQRLQGSDCRSQPPRPLMGLEETRENSRDINRGRNRGRGHRRSKNTRLQPHEIYRQNQQVLENMFVNKDYKRFFTITPDDGTDLSRKNTIRANKDLEKVLGGEPKKITELREGMLLVEVSSEIQSVRIREIKKLHETKVTVAEHKSLNSTKGTIIYNNKPGYTEKEICEELEKYNVTEVKKINRKEDNIRRADLFIVTFNNCILPTCIKIGWTKLKVREYIPKPRRCFQCQRWGHGAATCRVTQPVCMNCGDDFHGRDCARPSKCANCEEQHPSISEECFYYRFEEETLHIKYKEKVSYREAKEKATDKFITPGVTYAAIARPRNNKQPSTGTNKTTQQQVSSGNSTLNNAANTGKPASTSSSSNINSNVQKGHISGVRTQTEMNNVSVATDNTNKLANSSNMINISGNVTTGQARGQTQTEISNVANKHSNVEEIEKRSNINSGENAHKRSVQEAELEQESIATIINFHANEKKKHARDPINILKDAEQIARGSSEKMDIGQQSAPRLPIPSTSFPHAFKEPHPGIPLPSLGHGRPQRPQSRERGHSKERRTGTTADRSSSSNRQ